jgi:putative transposase
MRLYPYVDVFPFGIEGTIRAMAKFDSQKHHRRSIRIKEYDYAQPGAYFVTIVTHRREMLFGEIKNGETMLNDFGIIADECWRAIPEHFPFVELGAYVVMPNHVHGVIVINDMDDGTGRGVIDVGATHVIDGGGCANDGRGAIHLPRTAGAGYRAPTDHIEQFGKPIKGSLPTIIRTYKAAVTRRIGREHNAVSIWQRNYYEHIIRDEKDLQRITDYIEANPSRWDEDDENPIKVQPPT